jgi:hypothetical protein
MRRTKATLIYKRTKSLRVVQLLLGHSKLESKVWYLGIEVDDALEMQSAADGAGSTRRRIALHEFSFRAAACRRWHAETRLMQGFECPAGRA